MKIIKLKGGMGNQMFQYAFALYILKQSRDKDVKLDLSYYQHLLNDPIRKPRILKFNIRLPLATENDLNSNLRFKRKYKPLTKKYNFIVALETVVNNLYYFEPRRSKRNKELKRINFDKYNYYDGYWQSWRYVDAVKDEIKKDFTFKNELRLEVINAISIVKSTQSVCVGIRRGDYLDNQKSFGNLSVTDYYVRAMEYISKRIENPIFYVFSNDMSWVQENMSFSNYKVVYLSDDITLDDFEEFIVMSNCKHSIIPNSTFHWWAAYLNDSEDKIVISPEKWLYDGTKTDIVPPNWVGL